MKINTLFKRNKAVFSFEVFPPKKDSPIESVYGKLEEICALKPDFVSVTYGAGGSGAHSRTCEIAAKIKHDFGVESVAHLTCVNSTRAMIDETLEDFRQNGIENILALRGDYAEGVPPQKDFRYASELCAYIRAHGDFDVSGACYPEVHVDAADAAEDVLNLKKKVDAGAQHLISQLFFDNAVFYRFLERTKIAGIGVPIEAGIMPVTNKRQIEQARGAARRRHRLRGGADCRFARQRRGRHSPLHHEQPHCRQKNHTRGGNIIMITLTPLNRREAVRYLGGAGVQMNAEMERLMDVCEAQLRGAAQPKVVWKRIDLPCEALTAGEDIVRHLSGCTQAVLLGATLGAAVDRLIRVAQIRDMAQAVVLDSMASVAVEQVCTQADALLARQFPDMYMTFRFSPGYGDYPITLQADFLRLLDAPRKIGLTATEHYLLTPAKSVTAIAGLSPEPIEKQRRGCAVCSLRNTCQYRKNGEHCGF